MGTMLVVVPPPCIVPSEDRKRQIHDDQIRLELRHGVQEGSFVRHHDHGSEQRTRKVPDPFGQPRMPMGKNDALLPDKGPHSCRPAPREATTLRGRCPTASRSTDVPMLRPRRGKGTRRNTEGSWYYYGVGNFGTERPGPIRSVWSVPILLRPIRGEGRHVEDRSPFR